MFRPGRHLIAILILIFLLSACAVPADESDPYDQEGEATQVSILPAAPTPLLASGDKWPLWTEGTQLRGANIYQRRVFADLDGTEFMGPGPFGPPYSQEDFDRLAGLGANYVNLSVPGLYTVEPPYVLDEQAAANLDRLLAMAADADLFAVITFRSGPGRSEFAIIAGPDTHWLPAEYYINDVWGDPAAQDAWVEMWRTTAERYRDNPVVVGYDLMCEPNANALFDLWEPADFYAEYGGTTYDWNQLHPRLVAAIREVDPLTPILVGGDGYSVPEWLAYIQPDSDERIVYTFHQYDPHVYTHQEPSLTYYYPYPGEFDTDYDGSVDQFDQAWLEDLLGPDRLTPRGRPGWPLAVNEYGLVRYAPLAADFLRDEMDIFEQYGWNYAIWQWYPGWAPLAEGDNAFNLRFGTDAEILYAPERNELLDVLQEFWNRNTIRPSTFGQLP